MAGRTTNPLRFPYCAGQWHNPPPSACRHQSPTTARLGSLYCQRMTIIHLLARSTVVFLHRHIGQLGHLGIFLIDVVLQPTRRYSCRSHDPSQRKPLQQQFVVTTMPVASIRVLVSSAMRWLWGFSTNCRPHPLQANFGFPLWMVPFLMTLSDPHSGQLGMA